MSQAGAAHGQVVIADTGPLHYLVLIGAIDVLPALFSTVRVPNRVLAELSRKRTPARVRAWASSPPAWLEPQTAAPLDELLHPELGAGERAAIALARAAPRGPDPLLLIDDRLAVSAARAEGFLVTGTIGVLGEAAREGLIDLETAFTRLRATNFRYPAALLDTLLDKHRRGSDREPPDGA